MIHYECEIFIFILCELNFELVHENYCMNLHNTDHFKKEIVHLILVDNDLI